MKLQIEIDLENAAFKGGATCNEVRRILENVVDRIDLDDRGDSIKLRDTNGNTVGKAEVTA